MDSSNTGGNLTLTVVQGQLTRDVETFGKMDPYVTIMYQGQKYKTKIHDSAGLTPVWNHTFEIKLGSVNDDLDFACKDNDMVGAKTIGTAKIKATALCYNGGVRDWFQLYH
jgi:Ca2+-dependent lipid-binding protein